MQLNDYLKLELVIYKSLKSMLSEIKMLVPQFLPLQDGNINHPVSRNISKEQGSQG